MAFQVSTLPPSVQRAFAKGAKKWRDAVFEAIAAGIRDDQTLANIVFFMQHPERMSAGAGKDIDPKEPDFYKLRAEMDLYLIIVTRLQTPAIEPVVFLPENRSSDYQQFITPATSGLITLMVHGRNSDGSGRTDPKTGEWVGFHDRLGTFDSMQNTVESLGKGDDLFIASWQFMPQNLMLTTPPPPGSTGRTWANLLSDKAKDGVRIRVVISGQPLGSSLMTPFPPLDAFIAKIDADKRDNLKYIVSKHPDPTQLGTHHRKFIVARTAKGTVAYCGGLDISRARAPPGWSTQWVWHDVCAKLEGLIAHDLEREFIEEWNGGRNSSVTKPLKGWEAFEVLTLSTPSATDRLPAVSKHALQMLRTVSVGPDPPNIRRDDIWRVYFRLIARARRFIYLEDQYFNEPKLADAVVRQAEAQPDLIVIVMVGTGTDDVQTVDPKAGLVDKAIQTAQVDITQNAFALRLRFFKQLLVAPLSPDRIRVYTLNYPNGILHSKFILVDDEALSVGSANANPRGFFFDTELNVVLDDRAATTEFRQRLWSHNLGVPQGTVAKWKMSEFFAKWTAVANANLRVQATPEKMIGEGVIPFKPLDPSDPRFRAGKWGPIHTPLGALQPKETYF